MSVPVPNHGDNGPVAVPYDTPRVLNQRYSPSRRRRVLDVIRMVFGHRSSQNFRVGSRSSGCSVSPAPARAGLLPEHRVLCPLGAEIVTGAVGHRDRRVAAGPGQVRQRCRWRALPESRGSVMSVPVPNHLMMAPLLSRTGTPRVLNQRYSPSRRRTRPDVIRMVFGRRVVNFRVGWIVRMQCLASARSRSSEHRCLCPLGAGNNRSRRASRTRVEQGLGQVRQPCSLSRSSPTGSGRRSGNRRLHQGSGPTPPDSM